MSTGDTNRVFKYRILTSDGKTEKGIINASSEQEAIKYFKKQKYHIESITPVSSKKLTSVRVNDDDILHFTRLLQQFVKANIPVIKGFEIIIEQTKNNKFKQILQSIKMKLEKGESLSDAIRAYKNIFSELYINLVKSGEDSGKLEETLDHLFNYMKNMTSFKKKLKSALTYPIIILIFAFFIISGVILFLIPKFAELYSSFDKKLPPVTNAILNFSNFIKSNFLLVFLGIVVIGGLIYYLLKRYSGSKKFNKFLFAIPVFGKLLLNSIMVKFCRTFSTLIKNGVKMLNALDITKNVTGSSVFEGAISNLARRIKKGMSLSSAMREEKVFPPVVIQMVFMGEESGKLDDMLEYSSNMYNENLLSQIDIILALIQPIVIMFIGLVVGFIVVTVFLPIFQMSTLF